MMTVRSLGKDSVELSQTADSARNRAGKHVGVKIPDVEFDK